ncbi:hypothetical protein KY346_04310 [Candidatus Woesearchaeota archaeon]|nr:hypothetical protein [Candidatus Woesearchaeota archaeon]
MKLKKLLFIVLIVILLSFAVCAAKEDEAAKLAKKIEKKEKAREKETVKIINKYKGEAKAAAQYGVKSVKYRKEAEEQEYLAKVLVKTAAELPKGNKNIGGIKQQAADATAKAKDLRGKEAEAKQKQEEVYERRRAYIDRGVGYSLYDYLNAYDMYSGWNVYGALFLGDEKLARRREEAADLFCSNTLVLGDKECWRSKICDSFYTNRDPPAGQSLLVAQTSIGGYEPAVSIQGEQSLPITYQEGGKTKTKYIYKITYFIANPIKGRTLEYKVKLIGKTKTFTSPGITIEAATEEQFHSDARLGNNPLFAESNNNYHTVCLTFSPSIRTTGLFRTESEICAPLIQYEGAATKPYIETAEEGEEPEVVEGEEIGEEAEGDLLDGS